MADKVRWLGRGVEPTSYHDSSARPSERKVLSEAVLHLDLFWPRLVLPR